MDDFSLQHEQNGNVMILAVSGRVDSATAGSMDSELEKLIHENKKLVVTLKDVEFLSSAGVRAIVRALKTAKKSRSEIRLASIPDHIAEVMQTMGLMELVQVYPSQEEAIASFQF